MQARTPNLSSSNTGNTQKSLKGKLAFKRQAQLLAGSLAACISLGLGAQTPASSPASTPAKGNRFDQMSAGVFEAREKDWRNGAIVYQVLVDRFAPSADLEKKRHLYPAPKTLHPWSEEPKRGVYLEGARLWSHEIQFWGGDLQSLNGKLDYVASLGADVLYLNPIHLAYTNHKYDALDYNAVSPEFGQRSDVRALASRLHKLNMKLVLDGVFNHMGRNSEAFKEAQANPSSPYRGWFDFGSQYAGGARSWWLAENLPELVLENPAVRQHIYDSPNSVVRSYLRDGVDGWRLDVAVDLGFEYLSELTRAAHAEKAGSLIVGEIANFPKEWFPAVDGVMNFTLRHVILRTLRGEISPEVSTRMLERLFSEADFEHSLKSWTMLDNHDTERLATSLPNEPQRRLAQMLQFTLPGAPNLYYGSELGMSGGDDPAMRAPMRWDWVTPQNATLAWTKQLIALRKSSRALRVGNFRPITTGKLLGFERYTDRAEDTVLILANPSAVAVKEQVLVGNSKLMDNFKLLNALDAKAPPVPMTAALMEVSVPAYGFLVLKPETRPAGGYSAYKRVQ